MRWIMGLGTMAALAAAGAAVAQSGPPSEQDAPALVHMSCTGAPNEIRIVIKNVKKSEGLMTADLFKDDEAGFLYREGRVGRARFAARAPVTEFCLVAPSSGSFAIAVYHDRNANERFDKTSLGLPAEPYGISNNPKIRFAPPKVTEALFPVAPDGAIVEIALRN